MSEPKRIVVVAAVIYNPERTKVLLALRPLDKHQGGLWEFPGGKVDPGESLSQALARELQEEINILPVQCQPLMTIEHDYPDKSVRLDVWDVYDFTGMPKGLEGQELRWVAREDLAQLAFPEANRSIVEGVIAGSN